ncbi:T9SS type A sorting domain-containing protein [Chitinophaga sp.]|uniref:T9SS type A sorting domain-containing protein n=1 Tax=Chitinophaga sp. TaxID=1869181 RepID=UPI002C050E47|nr:T9SS type A sorting domain-containing protein [Chitinophaga sp.]HWV65828.1 T9SS type A sorting domain-containing protein [Chitinophaga sp.]
MRSIVLRCTLALLLPVCPYISSHAQVALKRQVVANTGGSAVVQNIQFQYTVGEPIILPITDGRVLLTQGFQQPEDFIKLTPGVNPVKSYILFPNPAVTNTRVVFDLLARVNVTLELINPAGQVIHHQFLEMGPGKSTVVLPVNHFASGIYTVMLNVNGNVFFEKLIVQ